MTQLHSVALWYQRRWRSQSQLCLPSRQITQSNEIAAMKLYGVLIATAIQLKVGSAEIFSAWSRFAGSVFTMPMKSRSPGRHAGRPWQRAMDSGTAV